MNALGLSEFGKAKGKGKAAGKTNEKAGAAAVVAPRTCTWDDCRAARSKATTWGTGTCCFACKRSLTARPPLENMVGWAFEALIAEEKSKAPKGKGKGKGKAAGKGSPATADADTAELRKKRLAELKDAKCDVGVPATPKAVTPVQELAKVFNDTQETQKKLEVDSELDKAMSLVEEKAKKVINSLRGETLPSTALLKPPEEIVENLVTKSASFKTDQGVAQAETALQTTREVLVTMRNGGTEESDELLRLMVAREKKQAAALKELTGKAPSHQTKQSSMAAIIADFTKALTSQADARSNGATKAQERAEERATLVEEVMEIAMRLKQAAEEAKLELDTAHAQRASQKELHGDKVLELLNGKLKVLQDEENDLEFEEFQDFLEEDDPATKTENERDEALRLTELLKLQLAQLQKAAEAPAAAPAQEPPPQQLATDPALQDLNCHCEVLEADLPPLDGQPSAEQVNWLASVWHFFAAAPFGQAPSVTFGGLGLPPHFAHSLVGNKAWQGYWGDRSHAISETNWVPLSMLPILKHVVNAKAAELATMKGEEEKAKARLKVALEGAALRRSRGCPY